MPVLTPLSKWWLRPAESWVALSGKQQITAAAFEQRVVSWVTLLQTHDGQRWAVFHHDAAECLAIICALWQLGKTACLTGDNLPDTVARLAAEVDGFIGEFEIDSVLQLSENAYSQQKIDWQMIAADHPALEVYTSGSTGLPKAISKTMQQLEEELAALDVLMPESPAAIVATTVSHQHLYGLTFRLLRPFCYQQAFTTQLSQYPEDLIALVEQYPSFSLVSSPSHLGRMNQLQDWHLIQRKCIDVISSTAPLSLENSLQVADMLQAPVTEIYGSSETGALAWRRQQSDDESALWQPLAHVELSKANDGSLSVLFSHDAIQVNLADQVEFFPQDRFNLQGRKDQIVKVEGKRVSLNEMNTLLQASDLVKQAQVLTLARHRIEMAAVIVLSDAGNALLHQAGRKSVIAALKKQLSDHFEAVVTPKRWRFVDALPFNSQGKLPKQNLIELFAKHAVKWPEVLSMKHQNDEITLDCRLPEQLIYFDGHFAQQPILPGVVQVHWAAFYGRKYFPVQGKFKQLEALKFQLLLLPAQRVSISLRYDAEKQKLFFSYQSEAGTHSNGRICYE
ncbi:MAG: AMP-binding protein [Methylophaga sp.]